MTYYERILEAYRKKRDEEIDGILSQFGEKPDEENCQNVYDIAYQAAQEGEFALLSSLFQRVSVRYVNIIHFNNKLLYALCEEGNLGGVNELLSVFEVRIHANITSENLSKCLKNVISNGYQNVAERLLELDSVIQRIRLFHDPIDVSSVLSREDYGAKNNAEIRAIILAQLLRSAQGSAFVPVFQAKRNDRSSTVSVVASGSELPKP